MGGSSVVWTPTATPRGSLAGANSTMESSSTRPWWEIHRKEEGKATLVAAAAAAVTVALAMREMEGCLTLRAAVEELFATAVTTAPAVVSDPTSAAAAPAVAVVAAVAVFRWNRPLLCAR